MFSQLPDEIIREISEFGQNPNSDFHKALKCVARGNLSKAKAILDKTSGEEDKTKLKELLLSSGTAVTRCGLIVKHKTLLECALGEGDPEMIEMIKSYFPMFENGENEMEIQLERYRPCIEDIQNQKPDDLTWLFDIIKRSSIQDVLAELAEGDDYDANYQSKLRTALNEFRAKKLDPKVRVITKPRMHCNYQNLRHAYDILDSCWDELKEWDEIENEYNFCRYYLFAQQVIGFIQLVELPSRERFLFARDQVIAETSGEKLKIERNMNYINSSGSFPNFDASLIKARSGFGFDSYSKIYGVCEKRGVSVSLLVIGYVTSSVLTELAANKIVRLAKLMPKYSKKKMTMCVIL